MLTTIDIDKLMESGCEREKKEKICRARGGESCAFDGAMIVLLPIADTAHIVHGPIACCGNSWEGRGTLSSKGIFHRMGFTTDMNEIDIVYGAEEKLYQAILRTYESVKPKAIFVYATCVSGLIGDDIEAVCKKAESKLCIRVIPVNAPGFIGPKNLGNRIAGEVLLNYVIGTGEPPFTTDYDINLIAEYNIAGDLWLVEPLLKEAGVRILSRITGDSTFEEITYAHRAKLNVVLCSRALINVAKEMKRRYGIPYVEGSFFGKTEMTKTLRAIGSRFEALSSKIEKIIEREEKRLEERLKEFSHLKGKRAVLYTGGVKSWSYISVLQDLGIEVVAVGTKKSSYEDEEKMRQLLGEDAPLIEDISPSKIKSLMKEKNAEILIAGGRNQYLAVKEGFPYVNVNQERHIPYAGYEGLINLAEQISNSIHFYKRKSELKKPVIEKLQSEIVINPLKHSQSIGAAIALQGVDRALPIIHGAPGCTFLAKVLLISHFREPIALVSTKLFTEDVIMGSEEKLLKTVKESMQKHNPDLIAIITSGLSEVKGDDVVGVVKQLKTQNSKCKIIHISTPDYEAGLEMGYAKAIETIIDTVEGEYTGCRNSIAGQVNILAGCHLTPADFMELREIIEAFGLKPIILPDLSSLDGSREEFSPLSKGITLPEIEQIKYSEFTIAIGRSMEVAAKKIKEKFGIEYTVLESVAGLECVDSFMKILSVLSGKEIPSKYKRERKILIDGMRDAHFYISGKKFCTALEPDLSIQISRVIEEMGARLSLSVVPVETSSIHEIYADKVVIGDFFSIKGEFDIIISNSHGELTAKRLGIPLYELGFPVFKRIGYTTKPTIGYRGTLWLINDIANIFTEVH